MSRPGGRPSPSSPRGAGVLPKLRENAALLRSYLGGNQKAYDLDEIFESIDEYDELLRRHSGRTLAEARVYEVGFGARPLRMRALMRRGVNATGVDLEAPVLLGKLSEYRRILSVNGGERALKSLVRHTLFDGNELRRFEHELQHRGWTCPEDVSRLVVSDAAELEVPAGSVDLIISEDVFEHIVPEALDRLLGHMSTWLKPDGLALIRPNVFTGITGGHLVEWARWTFHEPPRRRRSAPWEHLLRRRYSPNSYLNELWRRDFRELFQRRFDILEERVEQPDLGREFLRDGVAAELAGVPEDELFSNQILFVLRRSAIAR